MKKYLQKGLSISFLTGLLMVVSCKDDEPPAPAMISFAETEITVNEADGLIEIEINLNRPATENLDIEYELGGTAQDLEYYGANTPYPDYYINEDINDYGEISIKKGESSGVIQIELVRELYYEDTETIEITLTDVDSDTAVLPDDDTMVINVEQDNGDGLFIVLSWDYSDVDMDLFFWAENNAGDLALTVFNAAHIGYDGVNAPEVLFLPTEILSDGSYGISCNYYEGTADPMDFQVDFIKIENEDDVSTVTKMGSYTLANINTWDTGSGTDPVLVQTFEKSGTDFINFSEIETPVSGSRIISSKLPPEVKRILKK